MKKILILFYYISFSFSLLSNAALNPSTRKLEEITEFASKKVKTLKGFDKIVKRIETYTLFNGETKYRLFFDGEEIRKTQKELENLISKIIQEFDEQCQSQNQINANQYEKSIPKNTPIPKNELSFKNNMVSKNNPSQFCK